MEICLILNFAAPIAAPLRPKFDFVGSPKFCSSREKNFFARRSSFQTQLLCRPTATDGASTYVQRLLTIR